MKTYILNVPSANERRDFQLLQAEKLGLDAVLISAVTPRDISAAQFQQQAFMWERPLKITEVACFMSHHGVWQIIALGNEPALVLEDDAILAPTRPSSEVS
jgi:glycosyl transferase, family 25